MKKFIVPLLAVLLLGFVSCGGDPVALTVENANSILGQEYKGKVKITIPKNVIVIGDFVFEGCEFLETVTVPKNVKKIGKSAFANCKSLTKINIPNTVTEIDEAFMNCVSLESISIPKNVVSMTKTFFNCEKLKTVNIPNGVTALDGTFCGCKSLEKITIPEGVTNLNNAFSGCENLASVKVPESVIAMSYAFSGCTKLQTVNIPNGVTELYGTFRISGITSLEIPDSVTKIYNETFAYCPLSEITIPKDVALLDCDSFFMCENLEKIIFDDPNGWYYEYYDWWNGTKRVSVNLSDPSKNVETIRGKLSDERLLK